MTFARQPEPPWLPEAREMLASGQSYYGIAKTMGFSECKVTYWLSPNRREKRIANNRAARKAKAVAAGKTFRNCRKPSWVEKAKAYRAKGHSWALIGRLLKLHPETVRYQLVYAKGAKDDQSQ